MFDFPCVLRERPRITRMYEIPRLKFHWSILFWNPGIPPLLHARGTSSACRSEDAWAAYLETVVMIYFQQREARAKNSSIIRRKRRRSPCY